jgi:hypothetical protein
MAAASAAATKGGEAGAQGERVLLYLYDLTQGALLRLALAATRGHALAAARAELCAARQAWPRPCRLASWANRSKACGTRASLCLDTR